MLHIVFSERYLQYHFGKGHPFTPVRWEAVRDLLKSVDLPANWIEPDDADDEQILTVHALPFVEAVKSASFGGAGCVPLHFGLGTGDVPMFFGMHEATLAVCGGSITAAREIISNGASRALQLGGGLHHAMAGRAAGFCVYNDVALAIRQFLDSGMRVAFVDIDVHHSDGVQEIYYDEPNVLNISLHQTGRTLFPGTGFIEDRGGPSARGSVFNIPLEPGTHDAGYLACFDAVVPQAVSKFDPDVLVVEAGADAHYRDPLAQLELTTAAYDALFDRIVRIAEDSCGGRIVATLGGGYGFDATVRIWGMLAHHLAGRPAPDVLPEAWRSKWTEATGIEIHSSIHDTDRIEPSDRRRTLVDQANRKTVEELGRLI